MPKIVKKTGWFWESLHYLMVIITFGKNRRFRSMATTIGPVIAIPEYLWLSYENGHLDVLLAHERIHVAQYTRFGLGHPWLGWVIAAPLYALFPLPVGWAWFRWYMEREAYLATLRAINGSERWKTAYSIAGNLCSSSYFWTYFPTQKRIMKLADWLMERV